MWNGARVAVVVPAYNEAAHIAATLRAIPDYVDDIVVVDDGSRDGTARIASTLGRPAVRVIRHPSNRGVGAALRTGYVAAFEQGALVTAVMAGDGQMAPDDLATLLDPVTRGEADYAKGNRFDHPRCAVEMPWPRRVGSLLFSKLTSWACGVCVRDSQCGYTALHRSAAERIQLERLWKSYGYPNDLIGRVVLAGMNLREVPVTPIYNGARSGLGWRHVCFSIPFVLLAVAARRLAAQR